MMWRIAIVLGLACVSASCDSETTVDCHAICSRYQVCFNDDYDVDACTKQCEDSADKDSDYTKKADDCHACIDGRSCTGATFSCASECLGIVP